MEKHASITYNWSALANNEPEAAADWLAEEPDDQNKYLFIMFPGTGNDIWAVKSGQVYIHYDYAVTWKRCIGEKLPPTVEAVFNMRKPWSI